jgi:cytoskeletal protein RodZ
MSKEEPYRDQAEKLKQRIEKYKEPEHEDLSTLPPRSELHRHKKKKTKLKIKFPLLRLLVLFFILLPITIFSIYTYLGNKHIGTVNTSVPAKGYETINFEKSKSEQIIPNTSNKDQSKKTEKDKNTDKSQPIKQ